MQPEMSIDQNYLVSLAQKVLGDPSARIVEWSLDKLSGGLEFGSALYRLSGIASTGGLDRGWSLIVKAIQPDPHKDDPAGCHYWKREPLAYGSGLLVGLPGRVTAPRCLEVRENPDGSIWICIEEVKDAEARPWSLERYAQVARQLGELNGAYLGGRPLPSAAWLSHDWLRKYLQNAAPMVDFLRQNPAHPVVVKLLPGLSLPMTLAVWDEHPRMLKRLDEMPQTFCHQDAFERNLFYRNGELVAIDWSFVGIAPLGAELAALVGTFPLVRFPASQVKELEQVCFSGYLEGLRQAGWQPNPQQVRLSYCLSVTLRYVIGATVGEQLPGLLNPTTRDHWVEGLGQGEEGAEKNSPEVIAYYNSIALEALKTVGWGMLLRVAARTVRYAIRLGRKHHPAPAES